MTDPALVRSSAAAPWGAAADERVRPAGARKRRRQLWSYLFVVPAVLGMGFGFVFPLVTVVRNSFYAGSFYKLSFVGFDNYRFIFGDDVFIRSLTNNFRLLLTVPFMTIVALLVAVILNDGIRGWKVYRSSIFLPYILPAAGIGLTFSVFLQFNGGLNTFLRSVGLSSIAADWLGSQTWAIWSVGGVVVWQQLGFGVVVFLAALLSLPPEVTEAARIDGASWWQLQTKIHVPQIRTAIEFFMVTEAITVLSWVFTYVYVLTLGGPGNSSSVMEFYIWKNGFAQGSVGLANAAAVVVLLIASVLIAIYLRLRARPDAGARL
ncbi:MAG: sugar ABC transporter permease [Actinomycetes bacterium]